MGDAGTLLRAGRIDAFKHLRIDGSFIVREEEFQVARRGACFRFREPVNQFVNLLLGLHRPIIYQYWHELTEGLRYNARRYEKKVRRMLNPTHPTKLPRIKEALDVLRLRKRPDPRGHTSSPAGHNVGFRLAARRGRAGGNYARLREW